MTLITSAEYPQVRASIDLTLDAAAIPDAIIGLPVYQGAAEAEVLVRDPLAAGRTGDEGQHIKNAVVLLVAAALVPAVPQLAGEQFGTSYKYQRALPDQAALVNSLRGRAQEEIDAVLTPGDFAAQRPTAFDLACGRRGR